LNYSRDYSHLIPENGAEEEQISLCIRECLRESTTMPTATATSTAGGLSKGTEIIPTFMNTMEPTQSVEFSNSNDNDNINININKEEALDLETKRLPNCCFHCHKLNNSFQLTVSSILKINLWKDGSEIELKHCASSKTNVKSS
jgi:hypothetical protein